MNDSIISVVIHLFHRCYFDIYRLLLLFINELIDEWGEKDKKSLTKMGKNDLIGYNQAYQLSKPVINIDFYIKL